MHKSPFLLHKLICAAAMFALLLSANAKDKPACDTRSDRRAVDVLRAKIKSESLYSAWTKIDCLSFHIEQCNNKHIEVAIRELHTQQCGGDPNVAPIVDRFRVYKQSTRIDWYNVVDDEYLDFLKIHSIRQR